MTLPLRTSASATGAPSRGISCGSSRTAADKVGVLRRSQLTPRSKSPRVCTGGQVVFYQTSLARPEPVEPLRSLSTGADKKPSVTWPGRARLGVVSARAGQEWKRAAAAILNSCTENRSSRRASNDGEVAECSLAIWVPVRFGTIFDTGASINSIIVPAPGIKYRGATERARARWRRSWRGAPIGQKAVEVCQAVVARAQ